MKKTRFIPRVPRSKIRARESAKKLHDSLVIRVFCEPECLGIEGLTEDSVIFKTKEPKIGRRKIGTDLALLYQCSDGYEILLADGKFGIAYTLRRGEFQLNRTWKRFVYQNFWKTFLRYVADQLIQQNIILNPEKDVWLRIGIFREEITKQGLKINLSGPIRAKFPRIRLGKVKNAIAQSPAVV